MKPTVLKSWLKALRSGKYKQGRGALCQVDGKGEKSFCCLGVLCDLYNKDRKRKKKKTSFTQEIPVENTTEVGYIPSKPKAVVTYYGQEGSLPDEVVEWAGFKYQNCNGEFMQLNPKDKELPELIVLNDGSGSLFSEHRIPKHSFAKLAGIIEKNHHRL